MEYKDVSTVQANQAKEKTQQIINTKKQQEENKE